MRNVYTNTTAGNARPTKSYLVFICVHLRSSVDNNVCTRSHALRGNAYVPIIDKQCYVVEPCMDSHAERRNQRKQFSPQMDANERK